MTGTNMSDIPAAGGQIHDDTGSLAGELQPVSSPVGKKGLSARRWPPSLVAGVIMVGVTVLVGLVSFVWTPHSIDSTGDGGRLAGPSADFWIGTDRLGRDLFSQLMTGAQSAIIVAVAAVLIAGALGVVIGILAAGTTKTVDVALLNLIDLMIAFPTLLLAMLVVTVRGASLSSAVLAIGISGSAVIARVTRVNASRVLREDYVTASIASGTGWFGVVARHVLPNILPMLSVQLMILAGSAILAEASLSYLGLGAPPPAPSWGRMLKEAQSTLSVQPWGAIVPGIAIAWTVLGLNLLGDGLRERLDPSLRGDR
ncbi:ABC transporter permease [Timonella senegalensis]|uniref:ABC transporter permease n=1 Tax=Timonella senegalensis TaxID=1465825 RepID=UPI0028A9FA3F|nr:ABC transporter permease [Timonella senegalensis]